MYVASEAEMVLSLDADAGADAGAYADADAGAGTECLTVVTCLAAGCLRIHLALSTE